MTQASTSTSLSGRPLLSLLLDPRRARFQVAMAPGVQHQPLMSYLQRHHRQQQQGVVLHPM
jgi:hypothetical protein